MKTKWIRASAAAVAASAVMTLSAAQAEPLALEREQLPLTRTVAASQVSSDSTDLNDRLKSAEEGDVEAMNDLGVLYLVAGTTASEHAVGLYWLQRAIDGGSVNAMHNLAWMYLNGLGLPRDYANALAWFKRAAERGNAYAAYIVAVMAESGLGASPDLTLARTMYRQAAEAGSAPAMAWLAEDLARGGELVEAYAWLHIAAQSRLDERLQIVVLARLDSLTARLGTAERDEARAKAAHMVGAMRSRLAGRDAGVKSLRQSPRPAAQALAIRFAEANSGAPALNR